MGKENVFSLTEEEKKFIQLLKKGSSNITEVSEKFDIPKEEVFSLIDKLRQPIYEKTGYIVEFERNTRKIFLRRETGPGRVLKLPRISSKTVKILITSDWGLGLKNQQGDLIKTVFTEVEKEESEIWFSIVAGNFCAGRPRPKDIDDYFLFSYEEQLNYLTKHFPRTSFKHYLINSWRELSFKEPITIGEALAEQREDIKCYGNHKTVFSVGDTIIIVSHLESDSSAYTLSHSLQVAMEHYLDATEYVDLKENAPTILLIGGINTDFEIPPKLPLKKERKNNFYTQAIPSLHPATTRQLSKRGRRAIPFVLGYIILTLEFDKEGCLIREPKFDIKYLTAYQKKDNYLADIIPSQDLSKEEKKIIAAFEPRAKKNKSDKVGEKTYFLF